MTLLVTFMVLIGTVKINSPGETNEKIAGPLYTKSSSSLSLRYYTSDMSRLARNAILLKDLSLREKPSAITAVKDAKLTASSGLSAHR